MKSSAFTIQRVDRSDPGQMKGFLDFPIILYGKKPSIWNTIRKTRAIVASLPELHCYLAEDRNGTIIGRMALSANSGICDDSGTAYGQVGLLEVVKNYTFFAGLLDYARETLTECNSILFPIVYSTWHQYRFTTKGDRLFHFFMEPHNMDYYPEFTERYGVKERYNYKSYKTENIDQVIEKNYDSYTTALSQDITFRSFNKSDPTGELRKIYNLSTGVFQANPFYTDISWQEFNALYRDAIPLVDEKFCTIAYDKNDRPIGFIFSMPDYTKLMEQYNLNHMVNRIRLYLSRKKITGLIMKSGGILQEYWKSGIFSAITYLHAREAKARDFQYIIAALVFSENHSMKVLGETSQEKEYTLYQMKK